MKTYCIFKFRVKHILNFSHKKTFLHLKFEGKKEEKSDKRRINDEVVDVLFNAICIYVTARTDDLRLKVTKSTILLHFSPIIFYLTISAIQYEQ